jgi:GrpB-like predicted nucleotidyltransferase (UPF0157 family)
VAEQEPPFMIRECPPGDVQHCLAQIASLISAKLPHAEIEHVGSTAVHGCLTKGDMDVVVRVSAAEFAASLATLDALLARSNRNERTEDYAEYDYTGGTLPVSVQLVVAGEKYDDFHKLRDVLIRDGSALRRYNALKVAYNGRAMEAYRRAKAEFIEKLFRPAVPRTSGRG